MYLTKQVKLDNVQILDIKFHGKLGLLAISVIRDSSLSSVIIGNDIGDIFDNCSINKAQPTSSVMWHPTKPLLGIGWVDGELAVYDESKSILHDAPHIHKLPISSLSWSSLGSKLISADIEGNLNAWKIDHRGTFSQAPVYSYNGECAINCIVLRMPELKGSDVLDIRELARAAVRGDERALDLMSWTKNEGSIKLTGYSYIEVATFFAGLADGRVISINESGKVINVTSLEGSVVRLLYHDEKDVLIATTDIGMLIYHQLLTDGSSQEVMKVKLASRTPNPSLIWAGSTTLAICLGESMIKMWDIEREENYALKPDEILGYYSQSLLNVVDYSQKTKTLIAGTNKGQIVTWKIIGKEEPGEGPESQWCLLPPATGTCDASGSESVEKLATSFSNVLAVSTNLNSLFLLEERPMVSAFNDGIIVIQISAKEMIIQTYEQVNDSSQGLLLSNEVLVDDSTSKSKIPNKKVFVTVAVEHLIVNMDCTKENLAISDGDVIHVYEFNFNDPVIASICGQFECSSPILKMHQQNLYVTEKSQLQIRNFQGIVKQLVDLTNLDGKLTGININNNFMVCSTDKCYLRVFDLSRRDPKPMSPAKDFSEAVPSITSIKSVSVSCNGMNVTLSIEKQRKLEPKIYFWNIESDSVQYFNFTNGLGEQDEYNTFTQTRSRGKHNRRKSGRKSARVQNRRRRAQNAQGDTAFSVTQSILYNDVDDKDDDSQMESSEEDNDESIPPEFSKSEESVAYSDGRIGSIPISHYWDKSDPRLLVAEIESSADKQRKLPSSLNKITKESKTDERIIVSIFVTQDDGIMMFDNFITSKECSLLIGFDAPYFYFSTRVDIAYRNRSKDENSFLITRIMRDFIGLESSSKTNKQAILNFSYYLTIGNMDEAFKAMKLIKSELVWQNMARMCVKTRRLDVAAVCLGKMNYARAAMQLREARQNIPQMDAKIAMLALHLGMKDEAIKLLEKAQRYDILNELYQGMGEWDKAIDIAENYDRIHLKTTYYNYAKYLEEEKRYTEAIESFVKSGTHAFEVPRMLLDNPKNLEKFIRERPEKSLKKWWAQYMECCGQMKIALEFYAAAHDYLSLVRAYWLLGMEQKAMDICDDTGDRAACYHLARQFEAANNVDKAIQYFSRAKTYSSAIRLCKENNREGHLVNLALLGKVEDKIEAAHFLQTRPGYEDKAVMLFHKAGQIGRAVDLAFQAKQFGALQHISNDLSEKADPNMVQKCAGFFMENNQFDRAVDLLASNKQLWDALKLCVEYNVPMTEDLAEKLSPPKTTDGGDQQISTISRTGSNPPEYTESERARLLEGIAEIALSQRQYHLACKKFTQAGNQMMAMKSLLKSGDTSKIVFFANVAKSKDVYILAANYLQTLDWRREPEIMKNIIQFFVKGKSIDRLAAFYEACALSEIEEYQNYSKALTALGEAYKYCSKIKFDNEQQKSVKLESLKDRCSLIKRFVTAVDMLETSPDEAIQQCQALLDEQNLDRAVRYGDVYAAMVRYFIHQNKLKAAYSCLDEMKKRIRNPSVVTAYIDVSTLEFLHSSLNIPFQRPVVTNAEKQNNKNLPSDDEDDVLDDAVAAAIDEDLK